MEEAELRRILSSNIKHYRGLRGWSQEKLAEKMELSANFVADVETGKSWVSSLTLAKLASCFQVEAYELFRPEGAPADKTREAVKRLLGDVSAAFDHSIGKLSRKYLG